MTTTKILPSPIDSPRLVLAAEAFEVSLSSSEQSEQARKLLQELATMLGKSDVSLNQGLSGEILAGENLVVSVSHSSKFSQTQIAVAAADCAEFRSIGIDLENIARPMSPLLHDELVNNPSLVAAKDYYGQRSPMELYCSLEAAYKAISPLLGKNFDLRKINLSLENSSPQFSYEGYAGSLYKVDYLEDYIVMLAAIR